MAFTIRVTKSLLLAAWGTLMFAASIAVFAASARRGAGGSSAQKQQMYDNPYDYIEAEAHAGRHEGELRKLVNELRSNVDQMFDTVDPVIDPTDAQMEDLAEALDAGKRDIADILSRAGPPPELTDDDDANKAALQAWLDNINEVLPPLYDSVKEHNAKVAAIASDPDRPLAQLMQATQGGGYNAPPGYYGHFGYYDGAPPPPSSCSVAYDYEISCGGSVSGSLAPGETVYIGATKPLESSVTLSLCSSPSWDSVLATYLTECAALHDNSDYYSDDYCGSHGEITFHSYDVSFVPVSIKGYGNMYGGDFTLTMECDST